MTNDAFEAGLRRWHSRGCTAREANEAADGFEHELEAIDAYSNVAKTPAETWPAPGRQGCIPARIPEGTPPVDLHDVKKACERIGLSGFGHDADDLFRKLASDTVRRAELLYASWCTRTAIKNGKIRTSVVGHMLATIHRQRAAKQTVAVSLPA